MLGQVVRSTAGHDRGELFCVVGEEGPYLLLADGKRRKAAAPKRKKGKHTQGAGEFDHPVLKKISSQEPVTDNDIRRALAAFRCAKEV